MSKTDDFDVKQSEQLCEIHRNLRNKTKERLKFLFEATPLLRDLNCDVTHDEISAEIAIVKGESIKIYVKREPYQRLKVIVPRLCKISELKLAIQRSFNALQRRLRQLRANDGTASSKEKRRSKSSSEPIATISWKYIWQTYYLRHNGNALINNEKTLNDYDIRNKDILDFVKKIKIDRKTKRR